LSGFRNSDHHRHGIDGGGNKAVSFVEALHCFRDRVHQDRPDAGDIRSLHRALHGIAQQPGSDTLALMSFVDREAAKNHGRHRVRHIPPDAAGSFHMGDSADSEGVVAAHPRPTHTT